MLLIPALSNAQSLPFVAAETDAASLGKAGANLAESHAYASFSNAAAIPFSDVYTDVAVSYTNWQPSAINSKLLSVGAAINKNDKFGLAIGFMHGKNPAYDVTNASGTVNGQFVPSDMHVNVGLAWKMLPFLSFGANIGYASSTLAEKTSYNAIAADIFALAKFDALKVTAGVTNVGSTVKSASGKEFCIPGSIAVGAGYEKKLTDQHELDVLVDIDYYFSGWFAAAAGATYTYDNLVSLRAGYRHGGDSPIPSFLSLGAGVKYNGVKLDAAYLIGSGAARNTLALTLGFAF